MNKEIAEAHWKYTEGIIRRVPNLEPNEESLELMKYLYIAAMIHGAKHEEEGR